MNERTWGPFSGRQLTTMVVSLILVLGVPGTVWAVDTFSNVAIEDPVTGVKASVDASKRLKVGDGSGAMTVDGSVLAPETTPANLVRIFAAASSSCSNAYTIPAGKALILKSMSAYMHTAGSPGSDVEAIVYPVANCGGALAAAAISDRAHETVFQTFGSGIGVPAGRTISTLGFNASGTLYLYGYLVPASAVPATAAAKAAPQASGSTPTMAPKH
jgi:hypothetical protein